MELGKDLKFGHCAGIREERNSLFVTCMELKRKSKIQRNRFFSFP
jgi:hypothetical protein